MIHIVDIGSLRLPDGVVPYQPLLDRGLGRLTEFDPQQGTVAIGDGKMATLHVCKYPGWTSLLRPSVKFLGGFPYYEEAAKIIRQSQISTQRLDDLDIEPIDFLKLDVQGSEHAILENGHDNLRRCAVVQTEVAFAELNEGQPQWWQIHQELRSQGFVLHSLFDIKPPIEAEALYVRPGRQHLSIILEHCYSAQERRKAA
jgi:hypothetical protein